MANRDRHRQGLVYGPVRPSGPRDRGRIIGNLLGLLVVVVTVSVLALAIYFFVQARNNEQPPSTSAPPSAASAVGDPSPSVPALASASPTLSTAPGSTPLPTSLPTSPATTPATSADPVATPQPTFTVPQVAIGPGFITFGTNGDSRFRVTDPKTAFAVDEPMVWSAYLTGPADSAELLIRILKADGAGQTEPQLVRVDAVEPNVHGVQIFFRRLRPIGVSAGSGLFTVEYVRGDEILAQGSFLVQ